MAKNDDGYTFVLRRGELGGAEEGFTLPRVTRILDVVAKHGLLPYNYRLGGEGALRYVEHHGTDVGASDWTKVRKWLEQQGLDPKSRLVAAGGRGTRIHAAAESLLRSGEYAAPDKDDVEAGWYKSLDEWWQYFEAGLDKPIAVEQTVWHLADGYAGTVDGVIVSPQPFSRYLIDFKTGAGIYGTYHLQLAAYREAWNIMYPETPVDAAYVVRLPGDGSFDPERDITKCQASYDDFRSALMLYRALEGL